MTHPTVSEQDKALFAETLKILKGSEKSFDQRLPLTSLGSSSGQMTVTEWYPVAVTVVIDREWSRSGPETYRISSNHAAMPLYMTSSALVCFERGKDGRLLLFDVTRWVAEDGTVMRTVTSGGVAEPVDLLTHLFSAAEILDAAIAKVNVLQTRADARATELEVKMGQLRRLKKQGPRPVAARQS